MITKPFFKTTDNHTTNLYTLANANGFTVRITDFGGCIVNILTPDKDGQTKDVILGFQNPADYLKNPPFLGALIGRFANRIANGTFNLNGHTYRLQCNDGANRPNALHGVNCYGKRLWHATPLDDATLKLELDSPDGDSGFPGALQLAVTYHVTDQNELVLNYEATSDAPTVVNFTNHAYFNLNGEDALNCRDHAIRTIATQTTVVNENLAPTGQLLDVKDTAFDLTSEKTFEDIYADRRLPFAFDHNFVMGKQAGTFRHNVFTVKSKRTGIALEMDTDQPGVQLYMAAGLDGTCIGKCGQGYPAYSAFCLEAQNWPDAPNHADFPSPVLNPGETYTQKTVYRFKTLA